ncbi:MAG: J domain-containing protein, partial [Chromatiaceae bacterium]|nr:J domain-containing protein [Candidatus Thioaporhodococcus sediminis]
MNALLIELALAYYREPLRYPRLSDPHSPLPAGFANLIPPFGAALAPRHLAATAAAMAARPAEVREAARFFVRQVLLAPGASPQRILGFEAEAEASPVRIRQHYHLLIRLFHPDRQTHLADLDTENAARINAAYEALRGEAALEHAEHAEGEAAAAAIASDELRQFFQPQQRIVPLRVPGTGRSSWRRLDRRMGRVAALLLVVGSIGFILVALTQPDTVHLHLPASHDPATPTAPQPYYLHGTTKTSPEAKVARVQVAGSTYLASPASPAATPQERGEEERQAALAAAQR